MKKLWLWFILPVLIGIIVGLFVNWLTPLNPFGVIWKILKWFLSLFLIKITVSIFTIIIPLIIVLYLLFAVRRAHSVVDKQTNNEPDWKNYCEDHFFDIDWTWGYIYNEINKASIRPYCPKCQRPLIIRQDYSPNFFEMSCYYCQFRKEFDKVYETLINIVQIEIGRNIKTGEYKKP